MSKKDIDYIKKLAEKDKPVIAVVIDKEEATVKIYLGHVFWNVENSHAMTPFVCLNGELFWVNNEYIFKDINTGNIAKFCVDMAAIIQGGFENYQDCMKAHDNA